MDATRTRRTQDPARQRWYARWRTTRFARLGADSLGSDTDYRPAGRTGVCRSGNRPRIR